MSFASPARTPGPTDVETDPERIAAILARWREEEEAVRSRLAPAGVADPAQVMTMDGLGLFRAMADGRLPSVPIGASLDFWPVLFEPGRMVFQGHPSMKYVNPMGTIHGGWIATLLDSAVACAVHTTLPTGAAYTTAELKISYLKALSPQVPLVRAEGRLIQAGRKLGFAEGWLHGPDGRVYAHATTTCVML